MILGVCGNLFSEKFESLCLVKYVRDTAFTFLWCVCDTGFSDMCMKHRVYQGV